MTRVGARNPNVNIIALGKCICGLFPHNQIYSIFIFYNSDINCGFAQLYEIPLKQNKPTQNVLH